MNTYEMELYEELKETAKECDDLIKMIYYKKLPNQELKLRYKNLKISCRNRLSEIKRMSKPYNVDPKIYSRYIRNYSEAMDSGFTEPTNGNLEKMIHALEEASYKFKKFLDE